MSNSTFIPVQAAYLRAPLCSDKCVAIIIYNVFANTTDLLVTPLQRLSHVLVFHKVISQLDLSHFKTQLYFLRLTSRANHESGHKWLAFQLTNDSPWRYWSFGYAGFGPIRASFLCGGRCFHWSALHRRRKIDLVRHCFLRRGSKTGTGR